MKRRRLKSCERHSRSLSPESCTSTGSTTSSRSSHSLSSTSSSGSSDATTTSDNLSYSSRKRRRRPRDKRYGDQKDRRGQKRRRKQKDKHKHVNARSSVSRSHSRSRSRSPSSSTSEEARVLPVRQSARRSRMSSRDRPSGRRQRGRRQSRVKNSIRSNAEKPESNKEGVAALQSESTASYSCSLADAKTHEDDVKTELKKKEASAVMVAKPKRNAPAMTAAIGRLQKETPALCCNASIVEAITLLSTHDSEQVMTMYKDSQWTNCTYRDLYMLQWIRDIHLHPIQWQCQAEWLVATYVMLQSRDAWLAILGGDQDADSPAPEILDSIMKSWFHSSYSPRTAEIDEHTNSSAVQRYSSHRQEIWKYIQDHAAYTDGNVGMDTEWVVYLRKQWYCTARGWLEDHHHSSPLEQLVLQKVAESNGWPVSLLAHLFSS